VVGYIINHLPLRVSPNTIYLFVFLNEKVTWTTAVVVLYFNLRGIFFFNGIQVLNHLVHKFVSVENFKVRCLLCQKALRTLMFIRARILKNKSNSGSTSRTIAGYIYPVVRPVQYYTVRPKIEHISAYSNSM